MADVTAITSQMPRDLSPLAPSSPRPSLWERLKDLFAEIFDGNSRVADALVGLRHAVVTNNTLATNEDIEALSRETGIPVDKIRKAYAKDKVCQEVALRILRPIRERVANADKAAWVKVVPPRLTAIAELEERMIAQEREVAACRDALEAQWSEYDELCRDYPSDDTSREQYLDEIEKSLGKLNQKNAALIATRDEFLSKISYAHFMEQYNEEAKVSDRDKATWKAGYLPFWKERQDVATTPSGRTLLQEKVDPSINRFCPVLGATWAPAFRTREAILEDMQKALNRNSPLLFHMLLLEIQQLVYLARGGISIYQSLVNALGSNATDILDRVYQGDFSHKSTLERALSKIER